MPNQFYPIKRLVLSHSAASTMDSCYRKLEFSKFFGTPRQQDDNYAGDVGNALHRGFGKWLETYDEKKALFTFAMNFPFETEFIRPGQTPRSFEACYATLMALMQTHYLQGYEVATIKTQAGETKNAIEVPFAIKILGSPLDMDVWYIGYMDFILRNLHTGGFIVSDLKTTRTKMVDYSGRYEFDEQCVPYGIMLEHVLGHQIDDMEVAYLSAWIDLLEPDVQLNKFKKSSEHIQDWFRGLCERIDRIGNYYRSGWFPRASDGGQCVSFNRKCQYSEMCYTRDHDALNRMIQGEPRTELFPPGIEPWFTAELQWERPFKS